MSLFTHGLQTAGRKHRSSNWQTLYRNMSSKLFFSIVLAALSTAAWAQQPGSSQPVLGKRHLELLDRLNQSTSKTGRIHCLLALSEYHWSMERNFDSVASYAERVRSESKQLKFDSGYNEACYKLCRQAAFRHQFDQAWAIYDQVSRDQQARLLIIIGENYLFRRALLKKDLDTAYRYFSQALQISQSIHSDKWKHESLIAIGKYYFTIKETETAKKCFLEIIADFQHGKDSAAEAHIWSELGKYWPDKDTAIHYQLFAHGNALRIYQSLKDTGNIYSEMEDMSTIYFYHSNFEAAKTGYQNALRLRILTGKEPVNDYRALSWIEYTMGNLDEALSYILASEKNVKAHQDSWHSNYENVLLGLIYADIGQSEKSLQYFLAADKIDMSENLYWQEGGGAIPSSEPTRKGACLYKRI
jgi:tetratricopeptide (TPR) repeat protein